MVEYYIVITNLRFMDYSTLLNDKQYAAVSTTSQHTRVVAGAGSGKTRVLTYRISYLIEKMNVLPSSIVAIAFTNKVAEEMKVRALSLLHGLGQGLSVSTFHSYCAKFLRKEIDVLGFPNNFTIMDEEDQLALIKNIAVEKGFKKNDDIVKYSFGYIGYHKCNGRYPTDILLDEFSIEREKKALEFFHEYEKRKEQMLALDFDDLLLKTIQILQDFSEIREKWQNRISNILVDEFQDTNDIQFKLIKLLMNSKTSLYVVGDPDQTIYTWRGANQKIILDFNQAFPGAETIILDQNYRSTKPILDTANKLISHNKKRVPKNLFTERPSTIPVHAENRFSVYDEAKYVCDEIEHLMRLEDAKYSDVAILYRANYLTLPFEKELMRRRIPYYIYSGVKFFQRKEVKDALAYFRLIYNKKDDISFERIVNVPRRGIGDSTMDILKFEKSQLHLSYVEYLSEIEQHVTELKPKTVVALTMMINAMKNTRARLDENLEAYPKILEDFLVDIGYFEYLKSEDEDEGRLENVKTLLSDIVDYLKRYPESKFEDYLENATLQTSQDEMKDGDKVNLMTVHVAKGLEFKYVFVVCMNEDIFPSLKAMDEEGRDGEEEERRLCYVAFTRAKERLYVTCNSGYSYVLKANSMYSRFFKEAGLEFAKKDFYQKPPAKHNDFMSFLDEIYPDESYIEEPKVSDNGIRDWAVGDVAIHEVFGRGVVTAVIDETIIEVDFETHGKKSILANHPKITKEKRGITA